MFNLNIKELLQFFVKCSVLSALLPQRHPAEGMFEWINRAWGLLLAVLVVAQSPLQCRLLDDSPAKVLSASMDIAPGKSQAKGTKRSPVPEFCYANKGELPRKEQKRLCLFQLH